MSRRRRYYRNDHYDREDFWPRYVPVAERRANARKQIEKLSPKGQTISPVRLEGRTIASTFWGRSWCENLERYSDYSNRLPRGRSYVRNGSVVDLQIGPGEVRAQVAGSSLYTVKIKIAALSKPRWKAICSDCAGGVDSLVELLQGRFSKGVMERICLPGEGLFPMPSEIELHCSCPDWATMCKHVAATLYGVGSRLDHQPELLFRLRQVDEKELIAHAGSVPLTRKEVAADRVLAADGLAEIFGLEMAAAEGPTAAPKAAAKRRGRPSKVKPAASPATAPVDRSPGLPAAGPAPKKRGRPPKAKVMDAHRPGRPPKPKKKTVGEKAGRLKRKKPPTVK